MVLEDGGYLYRPMDWMDPATSHAMLVFNKDYVENHPDRVQKVVDAYVKRIKYEKDIPEGKKDRSWDKGMFMASEFQGLRVPRYDFPPKVRMDLLNEVQDLLIKYDYIGKKINISSFVDDSFSLRAAESIQSLVNMDDKTIKMDLADEGAVRIGYFHGGRTYLLYRAYINSLFEDEDANVTFFTKYSHKDGLYAVPKKDFLSFSKINSPALRISEVLNIPNFTNLVL